MTQEVFHNYTVSVIQETKNLSEFVRKTMERKGLTAREVEKRSGGNITHSYVNKIKNGDAKNPSPQILQAIAKGIGEPEEIIFAFVRGKSPEKKAIRNETLAFIDSAYNQISEKDRLAIDVLLDVVHQEIQRRQLNIKYSSGVEENMLKFGSILIKDNEIVAIKRFKTPSPPQKVSYEVFLKSGQTIVIKDKDVDDTVHKFYEDFESQTSEEVRVILPPNPESETLNFEGKAPTGPKLNFEDKKAAKGKSRVDKKRAEMDALIDKEK